MIFLGLLTVLDFRGQDFVLACDSLSFDHRQKKASKEKGEPAGQALFTAMLGDLCRTRKAGTARSPRTLVPTRAVQAPDRGRPPPSWHFQSDSSSRSPPCGLLSFLRQQELCEAGHINTQRRQEKVIGVLVHQQLSQQARGGDALVDDLRGHRHLDQGLAAGTGSPAPQVALDREYARYVVELFADAFTDAIDVAAAVWGGSNGGFWFMVHLHAVQLRLQHCALGLLAGICVRLGRWCQILKLLLNGGNIGINRFIEQTGLGRLQLLTASAESPELQDRHLVRDLVNPGLATLELAVFALQLLGPAGGRWLCAQAPITSLSTNTQITRMMPPSPIRLQGRPSTSASS